MSFLPLSSGRWGARVTHICGTRADFSFEPSDSHGCDLVVAVMLCIRAGHDSTGCGKVDSRGKTVPQRLKPFLLLITYERPKGRTLQKLACTKGTASAVPYKAKAMRGLAPEVRFLGDAGRNRPSFAACNGIENRTSGAEALSDRILYGTAEAVPFVQ
jgi:hypothetical protein